MTLFLTLLSASLHLLAGTAILLLSSWFIAACAVAGVGFNYMLPAVVIRALALIRIASGYGQMWLGHKDLTARITALRLNVFAGLQNRRAFDRAVDVDALSYQTEQVAAIWIGWVSQNAGSALSLLMTTLFALFVQIEQFSPWLMFCGAFVLIYSLLLMWGIRLAYEKQAKLEALQATIEHHIESVTLWHLQTNLVHPSTTALLALERRKQNACQWGLSILQLSSFTALFLMLRSHPASIPFEPIALVLPMALLASIDLFGRLFVTQDALQGYLVGRKKLTHYQQNQVAPTRLQTPIGSLQLNAFKASQTNMPNVDLNLEQCGLMLLRGSSGSGKSRLLQAINGLLPYDGERIINEQITREGLLNDCVYIEQQPYCLSDTLRNNLLLADPQADDKQLNIVLRQLGLPFDDLNQWLGSGGRQLSGGEQKRLGIARAILSHARLLLIDEPFEGLDKASIDRVTDQLNRLARYKKVVVASHQFPAELDFTAQLDLDAVGNQLSPLDQPSYQHESKN